MHSIHATKPVQCNDIGLMSLLFQRLAQFYYYVHTYWILSLHFCYHPYISIFLIQRIFSSLVNNGKTFTRYDFPTLWWRLVLYLDSNLLLTHRLFVLLFIRWIHPYTLYTGRHFEPASSLHTKLLLLRLLIISGFNKKCENKSYKVQ